MRCRIRDQELRDGKDPPKRLPNQGLYHQRLEGISQIGCGGERFFCANGNYYWRRWRMHLRRRVWSLQRSARHWLNLASLFRFCSRPQSIVFTGFNLSCLLDDCLVSLPQIAKAQNHDAKMVKDCLQRELKRPVMKESQEASFVSRLSSWIL